MRPDICQPCAPTASHSALGMQIWLLAFLLCQQDHHIDRRYLYCALDIALVEERREHTGGQGHLLRLLSMVEQEIDGASIGSYAPGHLYAVRSLQHGRDMGLVAELLSQLCE